jgi:hypothetical protein
MELLLVGSPILTVSLKVLPILMPIPSIGLEIMTISLHILAIASYIPTIALEILTVVPHLLPTLLKLSGAGPSVFIMLQLLPVLTKAPLVLPHILKVCSHVSVVLPKMAAVPLKVLPILAAIPPVLSHVLTILAGPPRSGRPSVHSQYRCTRVSLAQRGTATSRTLRADFLMIAPPVER